MKVKVTMKVKKVKKLLKKKVKVTKKLLKKKLKKD